MADINVNDIIDPKIIAELKKIHAEFSKQKKTVETLTTEYAGLIKQMKKGGYANYAKNVKKTDKAQSKLTVETKEYEKLQKRLITQQAKMNKAYKEQEKELTRLKMKKQAENKETKDSIVLGKRHRMNVTAQNSSLAQLEKALAMNRRAYANMSAAQRNSTKSGKRLNATIKQQAGSVDKIRTSMGQAQQRVGGYREAIKKAQMRMAAFAMAAIAMVRGIGRVIGAFVNFNLATAKVKAMSGATREEMKALTEQAKELGISTEKSAGQVAQLQLELSKKGFDPAQIQAATGAITNLSIATGEDLAQSAELASGVMNAFGMEAEQMPRIVDVMAKSFSSSALNLEKFKVGMGKVAPVAKQLGLNIEETTGYIGTLIDANVDASTASAQLRNILIKLNERGMTMKEGMAELAGATDKVGFATKLYGVRAGPIAALLSDNIDKSAELTETLNDSAGAAQEMADIMKDTLSGDIKAAKSAVEGFSIELGESSESGLRGIVQGFTKAVRWLAENINMIGKVLKGAIAGMAGYQVALTLATAKTRGLTKASGLLGKAMRGLSKLNPYALLGAAIAAATVMLIKHIKEQREVKKIAGEVTGEFISQKDRLNELFDTLEDAPKGSEAYKKAMKKLNTEYGKYLDHQITEQTNQSDLNRLRQTSIEKLQKEAMARLQSRLQAEVMDKIYAKVASEQAKLSRVVARAFGETEEQVMDDVKSMTKVIKADTETIFELQKKARKYTQKGTVHISYPELRKSMTAYFGLSQKLNRSSVNQILDLARKYDKLNRKQGEVNREIELMAHNFGIAGDLFKTALPSNIEIYTEKSQQRLRDLASEYQALIDKAADDADKHDLLNEYLVERAELIKDLEKKDGDGVDEPDYEPDAANDYAEALDKINAEYGLAAGWAKNLNTEKEQQIGLMEAELTQQKALLALEEERALADYIVTPEEIKTTQEYIDYINELEESLKNLKDTEEDAEEGLSDYEKTLKGINAEYQLAATLAGNLDTKKEQGIAIIEAQLDKQKKLLALEKQMALEDYLPGEDEAAEVQKYIDEIERLKELLKEIKEGGDDAGEGMTDFQESLTKVSDFLDEWKDEMFEMSDALGGIFDGIADRKIEAIKREQEQDNAYFDRRMEHYDSDSAEYKQAENAKAMANEEANKKIAEQERKKAIFDRTQALFKITMEAAPGLIAYAATQQWGQFALLAALTAAQTAAVVAQPLPEYAEGLEMADKEHIGRIAEHGKPEIYLSPAGAASIIRKPQTQVIEKGASIIGEDETQKLLRGTIINSMLGGKHSEGEGSYDFDKLYSGLKNVERAIRRKPIAHLSRGLSMRDMDYIKRYDV